MSAIATGGTSAVAATQRRACPGTELPAGGVICATSADCPSGYWCGSNFASPLCLSYHQCSSPCGADSDCGPGMICEPSTAYCCIGAQSICVPACSSSNCPSDQTCQGNGHCGPKPCSQGYACPAGSQCAPTQSGADTHGCASESCTTGAYACPQDFVCAPGRWMDAHGCSPQSCADGYQCSPNANCNPSSTAYHGCVQKTCANDGDCTCGACLQGIGICSDQLSVCTPDPVSRAKYKTDIVYVDAAERAKLAADVQSIPLVRYRYRDAPDREHLGFIIEDVEPSPSVDGKNDRVDLYGYTSMVVAALQEQRAQIESAKREIRALQAALRKERRVK